MKKILKNTFTAILAFFFLISFSNEIKAEEQSNFHIATYITGIGCPHCANVAPGLLKEKVNECENNMIIIEYEIYDTPANSSVIFEFNSNYNSGLGIPMVIFSSENMLIGDREINNSFDNKCISADENIISLPDGRTANLYELDLNDLPLYPRIWSRDKIAVRIGDEEISEDINTLVINFISSSNPSEVIESSDLTKAASPEEIKISGGSVEFKNAVEVDGWILQWNGNTSEVLEDIKGSETKKSSSESSVSFVKTVTLALADSVNPCAIAILMMMLIAIVTYNPGNKKMVLLSGISFVGAVLVMYFIYGIFIVKFFDLIQSFKSIQAVITPVLSILMGIFSLILGFLEVKDFLNYKPGSFGTEMPLNLRPKVQKIISKVTSPWGAFVLGMFVTIFLLPCTIGPYFILGGLISTGSTAIGEMIPYLFLYNIIFVMPMIAVTAVIFFGVKNIDDVKNWKDKNVRILHLIAGILLTGLAIWVLIENIPSILSLFNIY
jgi:cytochrome c biogenesis protein CcdA